MPFPLRRRQRWMLVTSVFKLVIVLTVSVLVINTFYKKSEEKPELKEINKHVNVLNQPEIHRRPLQQNIGPPRETERVYIGQKGESWIKTELPCAWVPTARREGNRFYPMRVLREFGYSIRHRDEDFRPCEIIWTFEYPFWDRCWSQELYTYVTKHLKSDQKVNHFPGIGYIANKATLSRMGCSHCPLSFTLPQQKNEVLKVIAKHPDWQWLIKNSAHRGIKIAKPEEVNLTRPALLQKFVQNPLLIDGRKFDFSVYVAILSLDPLRVYMYDADWALRFCNTPYEPFNPSDTSSYVVYGTEHTPIWKMNALKQSWDNGYGFKKSLLIHLGSRGFNTKKLEDDVKLAIGSMLRDKENNMLEAAKAIYLAQNSTRNLFELVRFDFILDTELNVYLLEVNMSPDLETEESNPRSQLYTNFLYDLYTMVDIAHVVKGGDTGKTNPLMTLIPNIRTFSEVCSSQYCHANCSREVCRICPPCLSVLRENELYRAFNEHSNRRGYRRVVPEPFKSQEEAKKWTKGQHVQFATWSKDNQLMFSWFRGKCLEDITWCS